MTTRLRRVNNEDELHDKIDDYQIQGYKVKERTDKHARLRNTTFGSVGIHILWFLLTAGIGNFFYLLYAYNINSQEIVIKVKNKE